VQKRVVKKLTICHSGRTKKVTKKQLRALRKKAARRRGREAEDQAGRLQEEAEEALAILEGGSKGGPGDRPSFSKLARCAGS
jgi:hypothetical protein